MNPRLIKFAVELQNCEKNEQKKKNVRFLNLDYKAFLKELISEKVPVRVEK